MCTWDFCFIKPCQCLYHLVDNSIIFSGKITCNAKICREKNVKLTNWRHPYFPHFCWMVWGAGKFVFKTAMVYRVNTGGLLVALAPLGTWRASMFMAGEAERRIVKQNDGWSSGTTNVQAERWTTG